MPATAVATAGASQPQLAAVGRLNVNTATEKELLEVPGLDAAAVQAILTARATGHITDLTKLTPLSAEARVHLKTTGTSNFYRVLKLPLERLADAPATSASRR